MKLIFGITSLLVFLSAAPSGRAGTMVLSSPGFDGAGGLISGVLDLNILNPAPSAVTSPMGTSGWHGLSGVATQANLGFRAQVEVNQAGTSPGQGVIGYGLGASLGGLLGLEMPDSYLWQPMSGVSYAPNTTYTFAVDVEAGSLLNVTAFGNRGFGIGLTTEATTSSPGTFLADSLSSPSLLSISLVSGTTQRLVLSYTTGEVAPTGDIGIAVFGGRGSQALSVALLNDYRVDNASFSTAAGPAAVPEPSAALLLAGGLAVLAQRSRGRRSVAGPRQAIA